MQKAGDVDRLHLRMKDSKKRYLDMYCSLSIGSSGAVLLALWVCFIFINLFFIILSETERYVDLSFSHEEILIFHYFVILLSFKRFKA